MKTESQQAPAAGILFRGKEHPASGRAGNKPVPARLPALLLGAVVCAGLLTWSPQGVRDLVSNHAIEPRGGRPAGSRFDRAAAGQAALVDAEKTATGRGPREPANAGAQAVGSFEPAGSDDWMARLYPRLARIVELENRPSTSLLVELLPMLADADPAVRLAAVESLADLGAEAPLPALTAALEDPAAQVRIAAIEGLSLLADDDDASVASAIEARVFDRERRVRIAAIDALASIEADSSVPLLGALLYDADRSIRSSALAALGDIGGARAWRYLDPLRYDPDDSIRASANAILFEAGIVAGY